MQRSGALRAYGMPMAQGLGVSEAESSGRSKASRDSNGGVSPCCSQRSSNSNLSARRQ